MGVSYEQAVRSFCGKNQHTIQMLIVGPKVHLCDEYVDACIEVLRLRALRDGERVKPKDSAQYRHSILQQGPRR
jgi:ATP-dependent protease Clp ATPase subunit